MTSSKWRPNVLVLGLALTVVVGMFGRWMTLKMGAPIAPELLSMLIGTGLGPLIAIVALIATDGPPPVVPADVHERIVLGGGTPADGAVPGIVDRLKPNVLILGTLFVLTILVFGYWLIEAMQGRLALSQILTMVVAIGLSGLVTVIGYVAVDAPPPTVPADVHERIVLAKNGDK